MKWALSFLQPDTRPGILMLLAAITALVAANTPLSPLYDTLKGTLVAVSVGEMQIRKPLLLWINDGLMALFFFLVALEIKRETLRGSLSSLSQASLPLAGALGGMVIPALIYALLNADSPERFNGWAIPAATDIAFALGVLALIGNRIPSSLRVILLGIAIYDDLGAILVIALFYTDNLATDALVFAAAGMGALFLLNRLKVRQIVPYVLVGTIIWVAVLKSGIHATLAGFLVGLFVPLTIPGHASPLERAEHGLHPWVVYFVVPVFAFANAGVALIGIDSATAFGPVTLGIVLGLAIGKPVGVYSMVWLAVRLGLCRLPDGVNWRHILGVSMLTGIGFTMSLFIGELAFEGADFSAPIRIGVLLGSALSAIAGTAVLLTAPRKAAAAGDASSPARPTSKNYAEPAA